MEWNGLDTSVMGLLCIVNSMWWDKDRNGLLVSAISLSKPFALAIFGI